MMPCRPLDRRVYTVSTTEAPRLSDEPKAQRIGWTGRNERIMPESKINGTTTYYEIAGNGHPFVFIHGGHLESSSWSSQVAYFSKRYRTITYDIRGHGQSEVPREGYSISDCVEDLHQLLNHLALERVYLAGLSMGSYIAITFTLLHPERVDALVLAGANSGPVIETLRTRGEEKAARMRSKGTDSAKKFVKAHEANLARPDLTPRLSEIRQPVLMIVGEQDVITPTYISEAMHREIANSRMVVVPNCGHRCQEEQPDTFNSIVSDFLEKTESVGGEDRAH